MKAVLLINLGTPDNPGTAAVRKYLRSFLTDPRVIDTSPLSRFLLVYGAILPFRSSKSAHQYQKIWSENGSPLLYHSNKLKNKVQDELGDQYLVELAMRYQNPSLELALEKIRAAQPEEIIVLPLYPQYASSSTGSSLEKVLDILKKWEVIPSVRIISTFYDNPDFVRCFAEEAKKFNPNEYDHILFSFHGLPERQIKKASEHYGSNSCFLGNCCEEINSKNKFCYRANCFKTAHLIEEYLQLPKEKYTICFQSRLGRSEWIKPYTDEVIKQKARQGHKKLLVLSPAFVADCLETIHEISTEYQQLFQKHGGTTLDLVPSLNATAPWVQSICKLLKVN